MSDVEQAQNSQGPHITSERRPGQRWRAEFPYHWDADDMVTRRELLLFALMTSGTLFTGTTILAVLGLIDNRKRGSQQVIAQADQIKAGEALYFNYPTSEDQAVLLRRSDGQLVAYSMKCTHLSCAVYYQHDSNRLFCPCHEGVFEAETGLPIAGPPRRQLPRITLRQDGNTIYALEEVP